MFPRPSSLLLLPFLLLIPACGGDDPAGESPEQKSYHADGAVKAIQQFIEQRQQAKQARDRIDRSVPNWKLNLPKPPQVEFTAGKTYFWDLKTNQGMIRIELLPDVAPMHVSNILYLTELGFFDGTLFHRAIKEFMVQGGCPTGNGRGDPGYRLDLETDPSVQHDRPGIVAAANSGPNTDGSQFYITYVKYPSLDGGYSIFGRVTDGQLTLRAMEAVSARSGQGQAPAEPLLLEKAEYSVE